jgi:hypothetical protein
VAEAHAQGKVFRVAVLELEQLKIFTNKNQIFNSILFCGQQCVRCCHTVSLNLALNIFETTR